MKKIKVYYNPYDSRFDKIITSIKAKNPLLFAEQDPEIVYVIGGDGSMLFAHKNISKNAVFFGHGAGTLNFIMNPDLGDSSEILEHLLNDDIKYDIIETLKIDILIEKQSGEQIKFQAINDIVIGNNIMDWHNFIIDSECGSFDALNYKGMGICISTPLGSTAFSSNNYGTVLPLGSNTWSITSIVGDHRINEVMEPQDLTIRIESCRELPSVYIDGRTTEVQLKKGDIVKLKHSQDKFKIAFLDKWKFNKRRAKLIQKKR